jgi:predicted PurR-regulated permease PerM
MAPLPQPLWTALPCTFISILVTIVLTKATTSTKDKGLTTVLKAMCVFLLVLALMSAIVNIFLVSIVEDPGPSIENLSPLVNDLQDVERRDFDAQFEISNDDQVAEWRGGVQGEARWQEEVDQEGGREDEGEADPEDANQGILAEEEHFTGWEEGRGC